MFHPRPEHKRESMEELEQFDIDPVLVRPQHGEAYSEVLQIFPVLINC
jgi:hypothetical protein